MAVLKFVRTLSTRQDLSQMDLSQIPAIQPPKGVTSNFVDPPSLATLYRVIIYVFMPLMSILVLLRLGTRLRQMHKLATDDYLCILSAVAIISYCATVLVGKFAHAETRNILCVELTANGNSDADYPLGRHLWDVPLSFITERYLKLTTVGLVLHSLGSMFFKLTLLVLFLRLFSPIRWARWLIWAGIGSITILYAALCIYILDNCVPRKGQTWQYTTYYGTCTPAQERNSIVNGIFGLISDIYILIIPLWLVSHLSLPPKRKLGVMAVFLTGLMACGCSAGGLAARATWDPSDGTWSIVYVFGILELNIGLICACMPVVALPFKAMGAGLAASWNSIRNYSRTRLFVRSSSKETYNYDTTDTPSSRDEVPQLPQMVKGNGNVTGLRSFIRRAYRSTTTATNAQKTAPMTGQDGIDFSTLSVDSLHDYHSQLKVIHTVDTGGQESYPGYPGSGSVPLPLAPEPSQQSLRYQKWVSTGHLV